MENLIVTGIVYAMYAFCAVLFFCAEYYTKHGGFWKTVLSGFGCLGVGCLGVIGCTVANSFTESWGTGFINLGIAAAVTAGFFLLFLKTGKPVVAKN